MFYHTFQGFPGSTLIHTVRKLLAEELLGRRVLGNTPPVLFSEFINFVTEVAYDYVALLLKPCYDRVEALLSGTSVPSEAL